MKIRDHQHPYVPHDENPSDNQSLNDPLESSLSKSIDSLFSSSKNA